MPFKRNFQTFGLLTLNVLLLKCGARKKRKIKKAFFLDFLTDYMQDERETIYDIEMQASRFREIPKRSRYYQGMIDLNILERGAKYTELKNCYIIFICMENPFPEAGLHKYTFVTSCLEKPGLEMQDGSVRVILSSEGTEADANGEMQGFLSFLKDQICRTDLTRRLSAEAEKASVHERWRA